jgi:hypothetical protein
MTGSLPPRLRDSRHVIVTRFSVPRVHDRATAHLHGDAAWLESRLALFRTVDAAPPDAEVRCTRGFLRYDVRRARLCAYRRRLPSPLAPPAG